MTRKLLTAAALCALTPLPAAAVGGSISDGNVTFTRTSFGSAPNVSLTGVSPVFQSQLTQMGWWIRTSEGSSELPFPNPLFESYSGDTSHVTWYVYPDNFWIAVDEYVQVYDTADSGAASGYLRIRLDLSNQENETVSLVLVHYADLDVAGASNDSAVFVEKTPNEVLHVTDAGGQFAQYIGAVTGYVAPDQIHHRVDSYATLLASLNDGARTTFDGGLLPFGPGDFTGAYRFDLELDPGEGATVVILLPVNIRIHCSFFDGIFCDGFETGDRTLWAP